MLEKSMGFLVLAPNCLLHGAEGGAIASFITCVSFEGSTLDPALGLRHSTPSNPCPNPASVRCRTEAPAPPQRQVGERDPAARGPNTCLLLAFKNTQLPRGNSRHRRESITGAAAYVGHRTVWPHGTA